MNSEYNLKYELFDVELPKDINAKLAEIYESPYSVLEYFQIYGKSNGKRLKTLYLFENDLLKHILVFIINKNKAILLNELFKIEANDILKISQILFDKYPNLNKINVNRFAANTSDKFFKFPCLITTAINNAILQLPETINGYLDALGKQTKKHIQYYVNRINKSYSNFSFEIFETNNIFDKTIARIIEMNRNRITHKGKKNGIDSLYESRIIQFSKIYGLVGICKVDDAIIAGTLCYKINRNAFLPVIAHDDNYNKYNAGQICLFLTIQHLINSKIAFFHMLWGRSEYKYRFGAKDDNLYFLTIYKSKAAYCINKTYYFFLGFVKAGLSFIKKSIKPNHAN